MPKNRKKFRTSRKAIKRKGKGKESLKPGVIKRIVSPRRIVVERHGENRVKNAIRIKEFEKRHQEMLRKGKIKCMHYLLEPFNVKILRNKTIAVYYPAPTIENCIRALKGKKPREKASRQERKDFANALRILRESGLKPRDFLEKLLKAFNELRENCVKISSPLHPSNIVLFEENVIVKGFDKKSNKMVLVIIDAA
jgi:hypothetical protein